MEYEYMNFLVVVEIAEIRFANPKLCLNFCMMWRRLNVPQSIDDDGYPLYTALQGSHCDSNVCLHNVLDKMNSFQHKVQIDFVVDNVSK